MKVEVPRHVRETASPLGDGGAYALKVLAGRLADDPDYLVSPRLLRGSSGRCKFCSRRCCGGDLGVQLPVELRALWLLTASDDGAQGWGYLPGSKALMTLDAVRPFTG